MFNQLTQTTMLFIQKTLVNCEKHPNFFGAALSSPDGLILASHGQLPSDEAAACASSLFIESSNSLAYISESPAKTMLIWTDDKIITVSRLNDGSILLILFYITDTYQTIFEFSQLTAQKLDQALKMLG